MILRVALLVLVATTMSDACRADQPNKSDWLTGTWTLCEDPDHGPKDSLQFNPNGTGMLLSAKRNLEFVHKHTDDRVSLLVNAPKYVVPVNFTVPLSHDRLFLYSERTKHTSYYVRTDSNLVDRCTSK